jgi:arylsulfatase A-like enzyme
MYSLKKWIYYGLAIFIINHPAFSKNLSNTYNIILIINDQERYQIPSTITKELPARTFLQKQGVTFRNHYTAAAMCSPSRATFLTGTPPQINGVFDQMEYSYVPTLNPNLPNMGSELKKRGYQTAYFGKFEMDKKLLIKTKDTVNYSTLAKPYGFDVFNPNGDVGGTPLQGYHNDAYYVGEAVRWLRKTANNNANKKPFFMVLSLLNPHDIMYGDANLLGQPILQQAKSPVIFPPPNNTIYAKQLHFDLPISLVDSLTNPSMPKALNEYQIGWSGTLGYIPTSRKDMWNYYLNYYFNALRDNDTQLLQIITVLNQLNLWKNTIIILTADHGEMGGAHGGLRGKGPFAYEENIHIPLIIAHPEAPRGVQCDALTSHLDLLPTMIGLTQEGKNNNFRGYDFSNLILHPENKMVHAIREGILFNYVGISTIDGTYLMKTLMASFEHKNLPALTEINLSKRGFLFVVFNGRYKYARYYSPNNFNTPDSLSDIFADNDIQLFDLKNDPAERNNLALDREKNKDLILSMNRLLNKLIAKEIGKNNDSFLPEVIQSKH